MDVMEKIIGIMMALFVGALILPIALETWVGINTTTWGTTLELIWDNIPVIALVGIFITILVFAIKYYKTST